MAVIQQSVRVDGNGIIIFYAIKQFVGVLSVCLFPRVSVSITYVQFCQMVNLTITF